VLFAGLELRAHVLNTQESDGNCRMRKLLTQHQRWEIGKMAVQAM